MDEDFPEPEPERPRFLLPEGCKDLIDVIRLGERKGGNFARGIPWSYYFTESEVAAINTVKPASVALPERMSLGALAAALNLPFRLFCHLLNAITKCIANAPGKYHEEIELDFAMASVICAQLEVVVIKAPPPAPNV